jgi:hypothetical protein
LLSSDVVDCRPIIQYRSFTFRSIRFLFLTLCCLQVSLESKCRPRYFAVDDCGMRALLLLAHLRQATVSVSGCLPPSSTSTRLSSDSESQSQLSYDSRFTTNQFVLAPSLLYRKDGSVVYNCCWSSPAQLSSGPCPAGLMTIFYCLKFETPPTWRARSSYLYPPGTGWPSYTPKHWILCFDSPDIISARTHRKHTLPAIALVLHHVTILADGIENTVPRGASIDYVAWRDSSIFASLFIVPLPSDVCFLGPLNLAVT